MLRKFLGRVGPWTTTSANIVSHNSPLGMRDVYIIISSIVFPLSPDMVLVTCTSRCFGISAVEYGKLASSWNKANDLNVKSN